MENETIDKLKDAGYITSTDDSQGIADKVGIVEGMDPGDGENSLVQKGSNAVAFGVNSTAFGTSSTNAKDRGITEESTSEEILQEWASSDPEDQKGRAFRPTG